MGLGRLDVEALLIRLGFIKRNEKLRASRCPLFGGLALLGTPHEQGPPAPSSRHPTPRGLHTVTSHHVSPTPCRHPQPCPDMTSPPTKPSASPSMPLTRRRPPRAPRLRAGRAGVGDASSHLAGLASPRLAGRRPGCGRRGPPAPPSPRPGTPPERRPPRPLRSRGRPRRGARAGLEPGGGSPAQSEAREVAARYEGALRCCEVTERWGRLPGGAVGSLWVWVEILGLSFGWIGS